MAPKMGDGLMAAEYYQSLQYNAQQRWERDQRKLDFLKHRGYKVLVLWEETIKNDRNSVVTALQEFLT